MKCQKTMKLPVLQHETHGPFMFCPSLLMLLRSTNAHRSIAYFPFQHIELMYGHTVGIDPVLSTLSFVSVSLFHNNCSLKQKACRNPLFVAWRRHLCTAHWKAALMMIYSWVAMNWCNRGVETAHQDQNRTSGPFTWIKFKKVPWLPNDFACTLNTFYDRESQAHIKLFWNSCNVIKAINIFNTPMHVAFWTSKPSQIDFLPHRMSTAC